MPLLTCRELHDFLMAYLDHELGETDHDAFELHLAECPSCAAYLETYRTAVALGRAAFAGGEALALGDVPEELVRAVLAARRREGGAPEA